MILVSRESEMTCCLAMIYKVLNLHFLSTFLLLRLEEAVKKLQSPCPVSKIAFAFINGDKMYLTIFLLFCIHHHLSRWLPDKMERDSLKWPLNKPDILGRKCQILHSACQLHWVVFSFYESSRNFREGKQIYSNTKKEGSGQSKPSTYFPQINSLSGCGEIIKCHKQKEHVKLISCVLTTSQRSSSQGLRGASAWTWKIYPSSTTQMFPNALVLSLKRI